VGRVQQKPAGDAGLAQQVYQVAPVRWAMIRLVLHRKTRRRSALNKSPITAHDPITAIVSGFSLSSEPIASHKTDRVMSTQTGRLHHF